MNDDFERVLILLEDETQQLRTLAEKSGRNPRTFYHHSDLRGLDLRKQNLEGLNFDWANLRGASLNEVRISRGALNNAEVDDEYAHLKDEFDCYLSDLSYHQLSKMSMFGRFRGDLFDRIAREHQGTLKDLASRLGIGTATLRRMRNSDSVSIESLLSIFLKSGDFESERSSSNEGESIEELLRQPCIQFGEYDGDLFIPIPRSAIMSYIKMIDQLNALVTTNYRDSEGYFNWAVKPSNIAWYVRLYERSPSEAYQFVPIRSLPPPKGGLFDFDAK